MSKRVKTVGYFSLNGVDLTVQAESTDFEIDDDPQAATGLNDLATDDVVGLEGYSFNVTCFQDFSSGGVDATVWGMINNKTKGACVLRSKSGAAAADNFQYTGTVMVESYNPFSGGPNDVHRCVIGLRVAGAASARAVA